MGNEEQQGIGQRSLARGLLAGLAGGVAGTIAMTFAERMFPPKSEDYGDEPAELLADKVAGELSPEAREFVAEGIEWTLGIAAGGVYGMLAEYYPAATSKEGASFGIALEALTHEKALPALGLLRPKEEQTVRELASEVTAFTVYGIATEMIRKFVRNRL
ncbi:MAG TPA: DUF1440 domain-containing protein [Acidobacteriaceae bacterium]|nr:DUF1440 domain-containing protein [Acidobacteriaceae bacterium]